MIGIQEDVLNMFFICHFLLLFSSLGLAFFFTILICVRNNPNFRSSFASDAVSWWGGGRRRQAQPVFVRDEPSRRGWFASRFN